MKLINNTMVKENPLLRIVLGVCPALTVTAVAKDSVILGILVTMVLLLSNLIIALLVKIVPEKAIVPIYITILAGIVTMVGLLMEGYFYQIHQNLGMFLPLILVNSMILGKGEDIQSPIHSLVDGLKMGLGFTGFMTILGIIRETLGSGTCFGMAMLPESVEPFTVMTSATGGFMIFGMILGLIAHCTTEKPLEESVAEEMTP